MINFLVKLLSCSQFHQQLDSFSANFVLKKFKYNVSTGKLKFNCGKKVVDKKLEKLTQGVDFANIFARLFHLKYLKNFLVKCNWRIMNGAEFLLNGAKIWQILGHKFGKFSIEVYGGMLRKLNSQFFTKRCAMRQQLFAWQKKLIKSTT
jgi:hypothetical protein